MKYASLVLTLCWLISCKHKPGNEEGKKSYRTAGFVLRLSPELDKIVDSNTRGEIIATGFEWAEGPLWLEGKQILLFSDVPKNIVYQWTDADSIQDFLLVSGYTDSAKRGGEMGSNGLLLNNDGKLVLCQCGNRQVVYMKGSIDRPKPEYVSLAYSYEGKRFNSPNDATLAPNGDIYFTDPPYGLEHGENDPLRQVPYNGVYKIRKDGKIFLLVDSLTRPNGIAYLKSTNQLLISNSDPAKPNWYIYDVTGDSVKNGRIFASANGYDRSFAGLPDGMKLDSAENVFATGPGGVHIMNKKGETLGLLRFDDPVSNCSLSADGKTIYLTNDHQIIRMKLRK